MKSILLVALAISLETALAQVAGWGRCGGIGYSGSTSCTSGFACTSQNPYYYQCVPSTSTSSHTTTTTQKTTTTTKKTTTTTTTKRTTTTSKSTTTTTTPEPTSTTSSTTTSTASSTASSTGPTCTGTWTDISAAQFVQNISPGWNLGNTLDATPTEGSWNNPPVVLSTFQTIKDTGFKGVRIPITWIDHFTSGAPNYTVDPTWLERVSTVVDMATSQGLYTIVNVHHDATDWADIDASGANITEIEQKFYQLWYQIGTTLACKPSLVAFETINEPPCNNQTDGDEINRLNAIMLEAINAAGGWNSQRVVTLVGCNEDSIDTSEWFVAPTGYPNPWAIQFHYYSPYEFIFSAWGSTIWGSAADEAALAGDFANIRGNFTDIPLLIGEFSASPQNTEPAARWKYTDYLAKTAMQYNMGYILWDNGLDNLDRSTGQWRDLTSIQLLLDEAKGIESALPDSTEDSSATTQWSSAYIFHQRGTAVTDQSLPFIFNGNTLTSISDSTGATLTSGTDYSVSGANITFTSSYLSTHYSSTTAPGVLANLTLTFSAGAQPVIQIVQWDQPTLGSTSAVASDVSSSDLTIPITWAGLEEVATVKAIEANGVYLQNTWTVYLPALQQARLTYSNDYTWTSSSVTITQADIEDVIAANETTVFTFEFFPRDNGVYNAVNFTLTV